MTSRTRKRLPVVAEGPLPPLFDRWLRELLEGPLPNETEATCDDCAMLAPPGEAGAANAFAPESKCCTYVPYIASFLVGRILVDRDPAARVGRRSVEARIDAKIGVSPFGLEVPEAYRVLYLHAARHDEFGRAATLRCPHYIEGPTKNCSVWKNRSAVCSTWFCKYVRGAVGAEMWRTGVLSLLQAVESALARWCILELGFDAPTLQRLFHAKQRDGDPDPRRGAELRAEAERHAVQWGNWAGRERAYYEACAEIVSALAWKDVLAIGGVEVRARAQVTRALAAAHARVELPERLVPKAFQVVELGRESARVSSYSPFDPLDLPVELLAVLPRFDGRPTRTIVKEIARKDGLELDDELLQKLTDFEILAAPPNRGG